MKHLRPEPLRRFATELLAAAGASADEARVVAQSLVDANLCGYDSHGVMRIPFYVDGLAQGETVSGVDLLVINESSTRLVADAQWGFGRVQAGRLLERLMSKAEQEGTGVGTLIHASHVGRLGEYCEIAAAAGLVSLMMVNTHGAARRVAPPGGKSPRLGTNPLAMGVPHGREPIVLDFSTSATAEGKVRVKKIAGQRVPEGWLLDSDGRPTTDPNALYANPPGSILPMGGDQAYKGFGLALMIDIFAGALSGGLCSRETPITPKGNCAFFLLLSPQQFGGMTHFVAEVEQLAQFVRHCPRRDGVDEILLPGDPERQSQAQRSATGVPLDEENWRELLKLADRLGVVPPAALA